MNGIEENKMKNVLTLRHFVLLLFIFSYTVYVFPQKTIIGKTKKGREVSVRLDEKTEAPLYIERFNEKVSTYGLTNDSLTESNVELLTRRIIDDYFPLFHINGDNIKISHIRSYPEMWSVEFQQTYNKVPVEGSRIAFHIEPGGGIPNLITKIYPDMQCNTNAELNASEAVEIAMQDFGPSILYPGAPEPQLVILPSEIDSNVAFHLTWKFILHKTENTLLYYVDAINGSILKTYNMRREEMPGSAPSFQNNNGIIQKQDTLNNIK